MKRISVNSKIIIALLCGVLLCGFLGWMTTGFTDFSKDGVSDRFSPSVNEKNLYSSESCTLKSGNSGDGIVITVNDDGSIKVKGKNESKTDSLEYTIGSVELKAGTYTFTALEGASKNSALVVAIGGDTELYADFGDNTFTLEADTTLTIKLVIKPEIEINATVLPVIVAGKEAADFYA